MKMKIGKDYELSGNRIAFWTSRKIEMWGLMIFSYLCIAISIFLLALTGLQGYFQFHLIQANHPQFALFTAIFYMFTETLVMFYFIGSGTAFKKSIKMGGGEPSLYENVKKLKWFSFPI